MKRLNNWFLARLKISFWLFIYIIGFFGLCSVILFAKRLGVETFFAAGILGVSDTYLFSDTTVISYVLIFFSSLLLMIFGKKNERLPIIFLVSPFGTIIKAAPIITYSFGPFLIMFYFLAVFIDNLREKTLIKNIKTNVKPLILFLIFILLQAVVALFNRAGMNFQGLLFMGILFIFFPIYLFDNHRKENDTLNILVFLALGLILSTMLASICALDQTSFEVMTRLVGRNDVALFGAQGNATMRSSAFIGDPNYYSVVLVVTLSLLFAYRHLFVKWSKIVLVCLFATLAVFGIMTFSLTFYLCFVILILIIVFVQRRIIFSTIGFLVTIGVLAFFCIGAFTFLDGLIETILKRIPVSFTLEDVVSVSALTSGRTGLWDAYFAFFGNNPGTIFFGFLSEPNSSEFLPAAQYPHNLYLSILFRWGLFGLFLFIGYIYSSYKIALEGKASSNKMAIGLTLILLFIFGMALDILFARAILYIYFAIFVVITAKPKSIGRPVTIDENDLKKENIIVELIPSLARGGAERFVASLAHSMSKTELVYVVTFYDDITEKNREIIANNENIKLVCLHKKRGLDFKFYDNLLWLIKSLKPKVIHTHIYALFNLLIATWSLRGLHIVHSVHNLAPNEAKHFRRILYYFAFKMKKVLPVAISISTKSSYEKYYHLSNIPLIYNGIDVDANVAPNTTRKNIMINVGRMTEQKNQLALVEAFEFFVTDNPHWELYIVGNGPLKEVIMERAKLLIAEGKLKILSDVENLNEVYNTCQAFVLPSIYEGNSIALLEAINYNLFIIATKVGAATEYLIPNVNGIFVSSPAMYDIYLALTKALPYLGKTNNQALLEKISIEKTASEYLSLFTQISEKKTKNKRHARV